jgi:hypothetical protein
MQALSRMLAVALAHAWDWHRRRRRRCCTAATPNPHVTRPPLIPFFFCWPICWITITITIADPHSTIDDESLGLGIWTSSVHVDRHRLCRLPIVPLTEQHSRKGWLPMTSVSS